jgi:HupE / UreJ protein
MKINLKFIVAFFAIILLNATFISAHDVVGDLENMSKSEALITYLGLGYKHILPLGFDHILFIISLVLLNANLKQLYWQSAAFTIGHCLTLGLAMYGVFSISPKIVEPLIALSIIYVAAENIFSPKLKASRIVLVLAFGLLHGMGFASALTEIGLPKSAFLASLLMFNLGVEFGQLTIIIFVYLLIKYIQKYSVIGWSKLIIPISSIIILISCYWFYERIV